MSTISHSAEILQIHSHSLEVKICRPEACSGCAIKSACNIKNHSYQQLTVNCKDTSPYYIGQTITLEISSQIGFQATFYAYLLPLIIMLSTLIICLHITDNELTAGIFSIFILVPYYIILFLCKKYLNQKFSFKISKK